MKFSTSAALATTAAIANAFPHLALENLARNAGLDVPSLRARAGLPASGVPFPPDPAQLTGEWNAKAQYVSNKGIHKYVKPGPNDSRGPCPGLNALANHGYLPHSGVGTISQFIQATYDAYGMAYDLGGFLAVFGAIFDGDLTSWSIGGPNALVSSGTGLIGSHNKYEADASPVRPDLYEYGNNYKINWAQWRALYDTQAGVPDDKANYNLAVLQAYRSKRWDQSLNNNKYFFNGPFSGVLVQPAAYTFAYRFMANHTAEHPDGVLDRHVLKSFYGITEHEDGTFSGGLGYEKIPDNWYKRAIGDEYSIPFFLSDVIYEASIYPKFIDVGGNTGGTNTFTGVAISNLTGGIFNGATLLEGNNLFCFAYQAQQNAIPDVVTGALGSLTQILEKYAPAAAKTIADMNCPQLAKIYENQLEQFPGYKKGGNVY